MGWLPLVPATSVSALPVMGTFWSCGSCSEASGQHTPQCRSAQQAASSAASMAQNRSLSSGLGSAANMLLSAVTAAAQTWTAFMREWAPGRERRALSRRGTRGVSSHLEVSCSCSRARAASRMRFAASGLLGIVRPCNTCAVCAPLILRCLVSMVADPSMMCMSSGAATCDSCCRASDTTTMPKFSTVSLRKVFGCNHSATVGRTLLSMASVCAVCDEPTSLMHQSQTNDGPHSNPTCKSFCLFKALTTRPNDCTHVAELLGPCVTCFMTRSVMPMPTGSATLRRQCRRLPLYMCKLAGAVAMFALGRLWACYH
jgi:hypothetical protein